MSKIIRNPKNYTGQELTNVFFRPMITGDSAQELGIRVLYNMPVPTTVGFWSKSADVLSPYEKGWEGYNGTIRDKKTINLSKVKAEMSYAAADYFSMVYEQIVCTGAVDLQDLSGTELEVAETELFRNAISESIRATMWLGDTDRRGMFGTFDGFLKRIKSDVGSSQNDITRVTMEQMQTEDTAEKLFQLMYYKANEKLRNLKKDGQLAYFVTSDVYENYQATLLAGDSDFARAARINGVDELQYRGIPIIDMKVSSYLDDLDDMSTTWAILTDRRNLTLAVNTADFPGSQISMWYNEDELENRQRAVFLAGCDYLMPELVVASFDDVE